MNSLLIKFNNKYAIIYVGLFKDIPALTKPVWLHHPAPLKAPPKVSSKVIGDRFSVLTLDRCGHRRRDVHTDEDQTDLSMSYIYVNMYKKNWRRRGLTF